MSYNNRYENRSNAWVHNTTLHHPIPRGTTPLLRSQTPLSRAQTPVGRPDVRRGSIGTTEPLHYSYERRPSSKFSHGASSPSPSDYTPSRSPSFASVNTLAPSHESSPQGKDLIRSFNNPFDDEPTKKKSQSTYVETIELSSSPSYASILPPPPPVHNIPLALPGPATARQPTLDRFERFLIWFELYRKLFFVTFMLNVAALVAVTHHKFGYGSKNVTSFALGNLLASVLARNEFFLRFAYWLTVKTCWVLPIRIRHWITEVFVHLGGIHSGCSSAGLMWAIYACVLAFQQRAVLPKSILAFAVLAPIALGISIAVAMPWVRHTHHNIFERFHRFVGWLGLAYLWILVVLLGIYNPATRHWDTEGAHLWRRQEFWDTVVLTVLIVLPWVGLQKIPVKVSVPHPKTAFLTFPGGIYTGLIGRISRSPWLEWHAFGIISEGPLAFTHHMLIVAQGDWTRELCSNPPEYVWTRSLKFAGLPYLAEMYERGVIVATGAGIGVTLSVYLQAKGHFHLIWIGSDLEKTYGPELMALLKKAVKGDRMTLVDTKIHGRPDTVALIDQVYRQIDAQVVFVTSNPKGTEVITRGCRYRGIPCFGPLFDS